MEILIGGNAGRSIIVYQHTQDKIMELSSNKAMAIVGPQGDCAHFGEYIQKNIVLYELRNEFSMSTNAVANYVRNSLAEALRKGPYEVNLLLGGVDAKGPSLYYLDYLGSMAKVNFGAHGYASNFCLSVFDRYWKPDMDLEQGKEVLKKCLNELSKRFIVSYPQWKFKLVTKDGIKTISLDGDEEPAASAEAESADGASMTAAPAAASSSSSSE